MLAMEGGIVEDESNPKKRAKTETDDSQSEIGRYRFRGFTPVDYAQEALECFGLHHLFKKPVYAVEKIVGFNCVTMPGHDGCGVRHICHVSFIAKHLRSGISDTFVFAELMSISDNQLDLTCWWATMVDDTGTVPGITYGCGICPHGKDFPHPTAKYTRYQIAQCDYKHPNDPCLQQKLAESFKRFALYQQNYPSFRMRDLFDSNLPIPNPDLSDHQFAELALRCINNEKGDEFELVETLGCGRTRTADLHNITIPLKIADWRHVCFTAKPKNAIASPVVHFFAELHDPGATGDFSLTCYSKVDPNDYGHGTVRGCGMCPSTDNYPHPAVVSYRAGTWPRRASVSTWDSDSEEEDFI